MSETSYKVFGGIHIGAHLIYGYLPTTKLDTLGEEERRIKYYLAGLIDVLGLEQGRPLSFSACFESLLPLDPLHNCYASEEVLAFRYRDYIDR